MKYNKKVFTKRSLVHKVFPNFINNKRGQVTIFIIVGLIILISSLVVININSKSKQLDVDMEFKESITSRPNFAKPVANYIEVCMQSTAKEAFILLGERGGYIYNNIALPIKGDFVNSQGVEFFGNVIPYWEYVDTPTGKTNGFNVIYNVPSLCKSNRACITTSAPGDDDMSIEGQVERYIDENIDSCLNNFNDFKNQRFDITKVTDFSSVVKIRESTGDVLIRATYDLNVAKDDDSANIDKYEAVLDFDFYSIYERIHHFITKQSQIGFIELHMLRVMDALAFTNEIPNYKTKVFFEDEQKWKVSSDIRPKIKHLIDNYVQTQKIMYTRNWYYTEIPDSVSYKNPVKSHYLDMVFDIYNGTSLRSTSIDFEYYPEYFDAKIWMADNEYKSGDKIKQKNVLGSMFDGIPLIEDVLSLVQIWEHQASYYVTYPTLITFTEHNAFTNYETTGDYMFSFAIESNIVDNIPVELYDNSAITQSISNTVLCDDQLKDVPLNITITDYLHETPVSNVEMSYTCAEKTCVISDSDINGNINIRVPDCGSIPYLTFKNNNYMLKRQEIDLDVQDINVELHPKITHNFQVKKISVSDIDDWLRRGSSSLGRLLSKAKPIDNKDTVAIQLSKVVKSFEEKNYQETIDIQKGKYQSKEVELINGTYRIMATLIRNEDVYIPHEFDRASNKSAKRCNVIGKASEMVHLDEMSHPLTGGWINFDTPNHYVCKDEPDDTFWPNWGLNLLGIPQGWNDYTQNTDCNNYMSDYFSDELPVFYQIEHESEITGDRYVYKDDKLLSFSEYDAKLTKPVSITTFSGMDVSEIKSGVGGALSSCQMKRLEELIDISTVVSMAALNKDYYHIATQDDNFPVIIIDPDCNNVTLEDYSNTYYELENIIDLSVIGAADMKITAITNNLEPAVILALEDLDINIMKKIEYYSDLIILEFESGQTVMESTPMQGGKFDTEQNIIDAVNTCSNIILDAVDSVDVDCGSMYDSKGFVNSAYVICMNNQYLNEIKKFNDGADWEAYGECFFEQGFCNEKVKWYSNHVFTGSDAKQSSHKSVFGDSISKQNVKPLYTMDERVYRACNLRHGYFSVGLDLGINPDNPDFKDEFDDDDELDEIIEKVDEFSALSDEDSFGGKYIHEFDGKMYRQFGNCQNSDATVYNNTNMTSEKTIIISEIDNRDKPYPTGGLMANEATNVFWEYDPYDSDNYGKNITFYVIEYDYLPLSYEDLTEQNGLIDYSQKAGFDLVKAFIK